MLRDLSELSRIEDGQWSPERAPVDLDAVARGVFDGHKVLAGIRRIAMEVETSPATPQVSGDKHMIGCFFDALLRMAGRLTREDGRIVLRLGPAAGGVGGELEHTGDALSADTWKGALAASALGPRPPEGYALVGLALAHRVAQAHGGELSFRPRAGGGAVYAFRFS
jgi:signal transduction histidine kinase